MANKLTIGQSAPDFTLPDEHGHMISLASFRGQKVILYFYPRDDTPGCTAQACGFRDHFVEIQEQNGVVIGISPDSAQSHQKFRTKYNLPFILLSDLNHAVAEQYGAWGEKNLMGVKALGIIRSHFVIDEQGKLVDVQIKVQAQASPDLAIHTLSSPQRES